MNTSESLKASKLSLLNFKSIPTLTFWITSISFFMCFFSWFGIVPFMPDVVKDLGLTPSYKRNAMIIGSVTCFLMGLSAELIPVKAD